MTVYQDLEQQSLILPGEGQGDLRDTIIDIIIIESPIPDAGDGSEIDRKRTVH